MLKRSYLLISAGFVAALAAGTFLTPSPTCATTGGCLVPSFAVSQYLGIIGSDILSNLSPNENHCKKQCDDLVDGCKGVADAAYRCTTRARTADLRAEERGCGDTPLLNAIGPAGGGSGAAQCKHDRRTQLANDLAALEQDRRSAQETCENQRPGCLADCGGIIKE
jgi:hypothetical protein